MVFGDIVVSVLLRVCMIVNMWFVLCGKVLIVEVIFWVVVGVIVVKILDLLIYFSGDGLRFLMVRYLIRFR